MKRLISLVCVASICIWATSLAQNPTPSKVTIKGTVVDTTNTTVPSAIVMLLNLKDSALVNYTRSDENGRFSFNNVKNTAYLFKISFLSFLPYQRVLQVSETAENNLGQLKIRPIAQNLMEVVIHAAQAPLSIHGDTIEYNVASFRVPPGSTVEELLRKLPGIEVDINGKITTQGKDINKVYVDGKTFFGTDPKMATRNLDAGYISKVQVYNEKTEEAKYTGVDDGNPDKVMNLKLKDQFKNGKFGKITVAGGTDNRWATRGSFNMFNKKSQFSFAGFGNNINETGSFFDDYSLFGSGIVVTSSSSPGNGNSKNYGGGTNYNYNYKKTRLGLSYQYSQTNSALYSTSYRQTFLQNTTLNSSDTTKESSFRYNHNINLHDEVQLDSINLLGITAVFSFNTSDRDRSVQQNFTNSELIPKNNLTTNNTNNLRTYSFSGNTRYSHSSHKKGKGTLSISAGVSKTNNNSVDKMYSLNRFFNATSFTEQVRQLNSNNDNNVESYNSSLMYTKKINKLFSFESNYSFSNSINRVDKPVYNDLLSNEKIDSISSYYTHKQMGNRLNSSIRFNSKGFNISTGLSVVATHLQGNYSTDRTAPSLTGPVVKNYNSLVPNLNFNYRINSSSSINANYQYSATEPRLTDIQPEPIINNPLFQTIGNPDLSVSRAHSLSMSFTLFNQKTFQSFSGSVSYSKSINPIVYSQVLEDVPNLGLRTITKPVNVSGGQNVNARATKNFNIIKTKLTLNASLSAGISENPTFINSELNTTTNKNLSNSLRFYLNLSTKLYFNFNSDITFTNVNYSIRTDQNQKMRNYALSSNGTWQFTKKSYLSTEFRYSIYRNKRFGFNENLPLLNASIRQVIDKKNRFELRLSLYDLFNKGRTINQSASLNYVEHNSTNTLSRYIMVSLSYNPRNFNVIREVF